MARTEFIRARVSPKTKKTLVAIASRSHTTVSHVIRDLIARVQNGGDVDGVAVRQDMAIVRQLANTVLAIAETLPDALSSADQLTDAGRRLRETAARHLGPVS